MRRFFAKYKRFGLFLLGFSTIIIYVFYQALLPKKNLKIYQPIDFNSNLVDDSLEHIKKYHTIAPFSLTNQNGETVTQDNFKNKIYVADFFFTTCPGICIPMTKNMKQIQDKVSVYGDVMLLSHTVTPAIDSVAQLKKYAIEKEVNDKLWHLVTGDKKQIYNLARKSYFAVLNDGDGGDLDMIHTENFILIDKAQRIRGTYDGTDSEEISRLLEDIEILRASYSK